MTAEELVESGKFVWDVNRLILHPDFEAELYRNYPQQSIEDGLLSAGISPADMATTKYTGCKKNLNIHLGRTQTAVLQGAVQLIILPPR